MAGITPIQSLRCIKTFSTVRSDQSISQYSFDEGVFLAYLLLRSAFRVMRGTVKVSAPKGFEWGKTF